MFSFQFWAIPELNRAGPVPMLTKKAAAAGGPWSGVMQSYFQDFLCFLCVEKNAVPAGYARFLQLIELAFFRAALTAFSGLLITRYEPCRENPCQCFIVHHATRYSQRNLISAAGTKKSSAAHSATAAKTIRTPSVFINPSIAFSPFKFNSCPSCKVFPVFKFPVT